MISIKLLGVPFDFGQDNSGVRLAYDYLKGAGLIQRLSPLGYFQDLGSLNFIEKKTEHKFNSIKSCKQASDANLKISKFISEQHISNDFLLNVGGDHGMALGTIHGILNHRPETIVVWADAHGDINTPETSPSGNFHGMPLSFLLGKARHPEFDWIEHKLKPHQLILIGPRDLDVEEKKIITELGVQYFSSDELNRLGAKEVLEIALERADPSGLAPLHLSFDVDFFDRQDIPSTGTTVADGPRMEEVFLLGGMLAETGRLRSMDLVEFNPLIGTEKEILASTELVLDLVTTILKQVFATPMEKLQRSRASFYKTMNNILFQSENP